MADTDQDFDVRPYLDGMAGGLAGVANVIMQLANPAVGYGVYESPVESGSAMKHPFKRGRTTATYLAVALLGNDDDKRAMRKAIDGVHKYIRSTPESPVSYNAFDPALQLWVGACLCKGTLDIIEALHGRPDDAAMDQLYAHFSSFATTLQVRPEMWPADRLAFDAYWKEQEERISIDDTIREYLLILMRLGNLPIWMAIFGRRFHRWVNTGFLPPRFREEMRLTWSAKDERRHRIVLRAVGWVSRKLPGPVRLFPLNVYLWDLRKRVKAGRRLV
ncbi:MAG TPA: oxygenase MpaB family protein [Nocardioidaceae bacterium]|nr:oxygenase MpaB family protein [Nocardioidaceae bacterium]